MEKSTIPNQRRISINKESCNTDMLYAKINIDALNSAMRTLRPAAFSLWLYFAQNQDSWKFFLSCKDACETCGFGRTAFHKAFSELVDKYYLIQDAKNHSHYEFYERPHEDPAEKTDIQISIHKSS